MNTGKFGFQSAGSSGGATATGTTELLVNLVAGNNTKPHGVTKDIFFIDVKDANNRVAEIGNFFWDATNIYVHMPVDLPSITFVITHKA